MVKKRRQMGGSSLFRNAEVIFFYARFSVGFGWFVRTSILNCIEYGNI